MLFILMAVGVAATLPFVFGLFDGDDDNGGDDAFGDLEQNHEISVQSGNDADGWEGELNRTELSDVKANLERNVGSFDDYSEFRDRLDANLKEEDGKLLRGNSGDNQMHGTGNVDIALGEAGDDTISMGGGDDLYGLGFLRAQLGDDVVRGGGGDDVISDGMGSDTLYGGTGRDEIYAFDEARDRGNDQIFGGYENDELYGDYADTISGGNGADTIHAAVRADAKDDEITVVSDFNPAEDHLKILMETDAPKTKQ